MSNPAKQYLEILIDDWQDRGQRISDRARNTFNELALLAEQVVLSGGDDKIVEAYMDTVRLRGASEALFAEAEARAAFNSATIKLIRTVVATVGAV
jgi:hypothetical protein